jgi:mono/diheme cytochrome c family protein
VPESLRDPNPNVMRNIALSAAILLGTLVLCVGLRDLHAEQISPVAEQLARGEDIYFASCAECHNADLSGGASHSAPPLVGDDFLAHWTGHNARDLLDRTRSTMPQGQPQSLSDRAYLDVVAFVLDRNRIDVGAAPFDENSARQIAMQRTGS